MSDYWEGWDQVEENEADILRKAILAFQDNFKTYIKEMDNDLYEKSVDYALTFTKIDGVTFEQNGERHDNEEEESF